MPKPLQIALNDYGGDLSRRWYLDYYRYFLDGSRSRHRVYISSRIKTVKSRRKAAAALMEEIKTDLLLQSPGATASPDNLGALGVCAALWRALAIKSGSMRSVKDYRSMLRRFEGWAQSVGLSCVPVRSFSSRHLLAFFDYLAPLVTARTYNNYKICFSSLFSVLVARGFAYQNPAAMVKARRISPARRLLLHPGEYAKYVEYLKKAAPRVYLFSQFIRFCFLRPNELRQIRAGYVDPVGQLVRVPAAVAKNGVEGAAVIPSVFLDQVAAAVDGLAPETFIFSTNFLPGSKPLPTTSIYYHYNRLQTKAPAWCRLYDNKHYGNFELYRRFSDAKLIQLANRHQRFSSTESYLNSFLVLNDQIQRLKER